MSAKIRYIGNPNTKEFHSIARIKLACNINIHDLDNPKYEKFKTQKEAHDAGFDSCAKGCVMKYKSKH